MTITFLGLGEMGSALARSAVAAGYPTHVWNRGSGRAVPDGAVQAPTAGDAIAAADVVVVCLFDHASVHEVLDPVAEQLAGRSIINLTTVTPDDARELSRWAADHGAQYLDGGVMAVPAMIGTPESLVYYSGSRSVFEAQRDLLEVWGGTEYFGEDAGLAALHDLALLAAMYVMFAGFFHGAALVGTVGTSAKDFAGRAAGWLAAVLPALAEYADVIDGGDYSLPGQQSLNFSDISEIVEASRAAGLNTDAVDMVQRLIHRQIDAGHGTDGFPRVIESIRAGGAA
ncbi:NAD(P)-dependent oxidoreductase [Mycolicibacterium sp. S2-37]|uniref:NAD(P)-dependent oxidoreductase n=1 Tax=Mycolicibacterium sp. S2-37 TaxID=2810297 RepID=UPI001A93C0C4|nr:NAD(P)-binding domain-containing protein [Mycolicibacterium sp. S2-37]MBO0681134.1 NAD(P)-dependent oxidoreductase [Mycolicibacterium sp. S2-37]